MGDFRHDFRMKIVGDLKYDFKGKYFWKNARMILRDTFYIKMSAKIAVNF